jgi:alkylhydroperoxidase/carboxymuconolactone decarboxylase family protein YurZ
MNGRKTDRSKSSKLGRACSENTKTYAQLSELDKKTYELIKVVLGCVFRYPLATEKHVQNALNAGASKQEISEALILAGAECGTPQPCWQKELFNKYLEK